MRTELLKKLEEKEILLARLKIKYVDEIAELADVEWEIEEIRKQINSLNENQIPVNQTGL